MVSKSTSTPSARITLLVMVILVVLIVGFGYQYSKAWAYAKTVPYVLSVSLVSETEVDLHIQYDYGYGYLPEHQQIKQVNADQQAQQVSISISAWKTLVKIRLHSKEAENIQVLAMSLRKGKSNLRISPSEQIADQGNVLVEALVSIGHAEK